MPTQCLNSEGRTQFYLSPIQKKNAQQQPSKEQEEPQPSVDQSTDTSQVNESLYCDKCTESVNHLIQCENCETWYCRSCERYQHRLWKLLVDIGNFTGSVALVRLK